jgi:hypothetical protein
MSAALAAAPRPRGRVWLQWKFPARRISSPCGMEEMILGAEAAPVWDLAVPGHRVAGPRQALGEALERRCEVRP